MSYWLRSRAVFAVGVACCFVSVILTSGGSTGGMIDYCMMGAQTEATMAIVFSLIACTVVAIRRTRMKPRSISITLMMALISVIALCLVGWAAIAG